jgi:uncharacterized membrane protein YvbJ
MISSVHNRLFSPGGCLTPLAIRGYLDGTLRLSGRMQVEEHLKKCKLCEEALEGFKSRGSNNYLHSDVEYLSRKVRRTYNSRSYSSGRKMPVFIVITLAVFLLVLVLIFYILLQNIMNQKGQEKVKADSTIQTQVLPEDASKVLHDEKSE